MVQFHFNISHQSEDFYIALVSPRKNGDKNTKVLKLVGK